MRKGSNRREPRIPAPNRVVARALQMNQNRQHQGRVKVLQFERFGGFLELLPRKL